MTLNLQKINITDSVSELVDIINSNMQQIANSNGGPVGKQGNPGLAGLPGARGPFGAQGPEGIQGSIWYAIASTSSFPNNARLGDYSIIKSNGDFYQLTANGWVLIGSFNFSKGITIDLEDSSYSWGNGIVYEILNNNLKTLVNSQTNQRLLLTNIDRPDLDLDIQIQGNDSPGNSYPFIAGSSDNKLHDYKLLNYNSGNSSDDSEKIYGRNVHFTNSYSMKTKENWKKASGFTFDVNLATGGSNSTGVGTEIFKIEGHSSGNASHLHRLEMHNMDLWVSNFRVTKTGLVSVGYSDTYINQQMLDVNGAILIGDTEANINNTIRIRSHQVQARLNGVWVNLGLQSEDFIDYLRIHPEAFNNLVIDTTTTGGIILGDMSAGTPKRGALKTSTNGLEWYNGDAWVNISKNISLNGDGDLVDSEGSQVAPKIAVNTNDNLNAGAKIYEGLVVTSKDKSVEVTQSVLESKYAIIDLSSKGGGGQFKDKDGNLVNANGMDIQSEDMEIKKEVDDNLMVFKLNLRGSQAFQDAVNNGFDLRSTNDSINLTPPGKDSKFWDLKISDKIIDALNNAGGKNSNPSVIRYTDDSSFLDIDYVNAFGGHVGYLPFADKDFDQNCNITDTNPLTITTTAEENGVFQLNTRVRFTIDTPPATGTFSSVRLCVFKDNIIISTLSKLSTQDIVNNTINNVKEYELQGSDLIDMSCLSGDCDNKIKIGIVADYGITVNTGSVTIVDSSISMYKIGIDGVISTINSNASFKSFDLLDANSNVVSSIQSNVSLGKFQIAESDYLDMSITGNIFSIDSNVAKLLIGLDPAGTKIKNSFDSIIIDGNYTHTATANAIIEYISGDNILLSLTDNKLTVSANTNNITLYSNANVVSNALTNIIFSEDFEVTNTSGNVNITLSDSYDEGAINRIHVYSDYRSLQSNFGVAQTENHALGLVDYNLYTDRTVALKYNTSNEEILNDNVGDITDSILNDAFILSPYENGDYEISTIVGFNIVALSNSIAPNKLYYVQDKAYVSIALFEVGSGDWGVRFGSNYTTGNLIKILGSLESSIDITKEYSIANTSKFAANRITSTTILSLDKNKKYAIGVISGNMLQNVNVLSKDAGILNMKSMFIGTNNLKNILYDSDISIIKLN